jgi:hypothetical protein
MPHVPVIEALAGLDDEFIYDNVRGILKTFGLTYSDARRVISMENYRDGTVEYHKALKAKIMICKAEIKDMYAFTTEQVPTPPQSGR